MMQLVCFVQTGHFKKSLYEKIVFLLNLRMTHPVLRGIFYPILHYVMWEELFSCIVGGNLLHTVVLSVMTTLLK